MSATICRNMKLRYLLCVRALGLRDSGTQFARTRLERTERTRITVAVGREQVVDGALQLGNLRALPVAILGQIVKPAQSDWDRFWSANFFLPVRNRAR